MQTPAPHLPPERIVDSQASHGERQFAMFLHLSALSFMIFPGLSILPAIIMWAVKKDESPFIDDHGKESVNFQISFLLWGLIAGLSILACIGIVLLPAVSIIAAIAIIISAVRANNGEFVRYPMTIRFIT